MSDELENDGADKTKARVDREAAALRANLSRRKAQKRAQKQSAHPDTPTALDDTRRSD